MYLLDITRTISRIGRGFATGIDRVEAAYLKYCIEHPSDTLFVARLGRHSVVIDKKTTKDLLARVNGAQKWETPAFSDILRFKLSWEQRCARSFVKRNALAKAPTRDVSKLFTKIDLSGYEYLNVGHTNLSEEFFKALKATKCGKTRVMIHDMIPLDYPEFSQPHIPVQFERRMRAVARYADQIICNSDETRKRVQYYFQKWGAVPECIVVHLGIEPMPAPKKITPPVTGPYYVVLGTIEPRKNHLLLFRVWERLSAELGKDQMPHLFVVGRRGWSNIEAFQFLDESMLMGRSITEKTDLNDVELANLLVGSKALLFPSFVEGFGLPALEAAQLGVPVICSNLATFEEILKGSAVYLAPESTEDWRVAIRQDLAKETTSADSRAQDAKRVKIPTWESHFRHVFC